MILLWLVQLRSLFERTDEVYSLLPIEQFVGATVLDFGECALSCY